VTKLDTREVFTAYIKKNLIGPANDTFADAGENEVISDLPLRRYFSGIVFPNLHGSDATGFMPYTDDGQPDDEDETAIDDQEGWSTDPDSIDNQVSTDPADSDDFTRKELYPYSFGLSFCLSNAATCLKTHLRFGRYRQVDPTLEVHPGYRVKISQEDYDQIKHFNPGNSQYLSDLLGYDPESGTAYLKRKVFGTHGKEPTGDIKNFRDIRQSISDRRKTALAEEKERYSRLDTIFRLLAPLYKKGWAREPQSYEIDIPIDRIASGEPFVFESPYDRETSICFRLHALLIDKQEEILIIKILVENCSESSTQLPVVTGRPVMNEKCMFQTCLQVESEHLKPFPKPPLAPGTPFEDMITECQYRRTKIYGQSFNCACSWNATSQGGMLVSTEFIPEVIPPVTTNTRYNELQDTLNIMDNSCFSQIADNEVLERLTKLADCYESWIKEQAALNIEPDYQQTALMIIEHQKETLARLRNGINLLRDDPSILRLYRLANAAMLVNMAKSRKRGLDLDITSWKGLQYHPFQLAFLLINIPCAVDPDSKSRQDSIDLLWFPTGGGKTEAYLLLSAFTMLLRKFRHGSSGLGTAVIMRYTLRLLTAQQFERAARLVLSLNHVCSKFYPELIADEPFTIGLWIGGASSPNKLLEGEGSAFEIYKQIIEAATLEAAKQANKFPIGDCPWCGRSLVELGRSGFNCLKSGFRINCLDPACPFHANLPVDLVDESLYLHPPSLLFATVDKFARLAWVPESAAFFGEGDRLPPELIIQDELHLISGPLGSITALFEGVVEMLCRKSGKMPRIIASTATIKNASSQVRALFGNRSVSTFPPPGIDQEDNFFAREDKNNLNREYLGIMPAGKTVTTTQVKLLALLLARRFELMKSRHPGIDNYWTLISYYNSLRELGRMYGKARDEIQQAFMHAILKRNPFSKRYSLNRPRELTSRISGFEIKNVLHSLELVNMIADNPEDSIYTAIDIVFATNMISVGLDIERLNMIVMNGQPKNVSEYIQVTSRIARKHPGLVFTLFNPFKARDRSHYENFISFHNNFYRFVEPISVTPYTRVALRKMVPTLMAAYLRIYKGIDNVADVKDADLDELKELMSQRINDPEMTSFLFKKLSLHMDYLHDRLSRDPGLKFKTLLKSASDAAVLDHDDGDWLTMNSMREISPNAVIKIVSSGKKRKVKDYE